MDVVDIERKNIAESKETALIYNPLKKDFICQYDRKSYTVPSKEIKKFNKTLAKHIGKHLVNAYLNTKKENYPRSKAEGVVFTND